MSSSFHWTISPWGQVSYYLHTFVYSQDPKLLNLTQSRCSQPLIGNKWLNEWIFTLSLSYIPTRVSLLLLGRYIFFLFVDISALTCSGNLWLDDLQVVLQGSRYEERTFFCLGSKGPLCIAGVHGNSMTDKAQLRLCDDTSSLVLSHVWWSSYSQMMASCILPGLVPALPIFGLMFMIWLLYPGVAS